MVIDLLSASNDGIEPGWTKEETDYLMELIKDYDMRWIIISDRYDSKKYPNRTIEVSFSILFHALICKGFERAVFQNSKGAGSNARRN